MNLYVVHMQDDAGTILFVLGKDTNEVRDTVCGYTSTNFDIREVIATTRQDAPTIFDPNIKRLIDLADVLDF